MADDATKAAGLQLRSFVMNEGGASLNLNNLRLVIDLIRHFYYYSNDSNNLSAADCIKFVNEYLNRKNNQVNTLIQNVMNSAGLESEYRQFSSTTSDISNLLEGIESAQDMYASFIASMINVQSENIANNDTVRKLFNALDEAMKNKVYNHLNGASKSALKTTTFKNS